MRAVMLSVRPQWCEMIANGQKTVEVRKNRPKLETPFKCYIYCTLPKKVLRYVFGPEDYEGIFPPEQISDKKVFCKIPDGSSPFCSEPYRGSVIGEFVCDNIVGWGVNPLTDLYDVFQNELVQTCISSKDFEDYGGGKWLYGWHITALQIYDKPRELSEFRKPIMPTGLRYEDDAIKRAPQSWCYVEELT